MPNARIPLAPVVSSFVKSIGYDAVTRQLVVMHKDRRVYRYQKVPPTIYSDLLKVAARGGSVGKFLHQYVTGKYTAT